MVTTRSARKGTSSSSPSSTRSTPAPPSLSPTSPTPTTTNSTRAPRRNNHNNKNNSNNSNNSNSNSASNPQQQQLWAHAPTRATLLWFLVSLPLVVWDSLYVLLRPWTMEGGAWHWPLWTPYKLYGEVDHVYGWKAFRARNGFTAAQGSLNVVETALYFAYLGIWFYYSASASASASASRSYAYESVAGRDRGLLVKVLTGRPAAVAVLLAFSSAVMTLSKTVLYWLNEYFSGFDNIGHNSWQDLVLLWIIPNGLWLVFPTYMIYVMGGEIIDGLTAASTGVSVKSE